VSRKHKSHAPLPLAEVKAKAERAAREGRFQQALELAKQICKEQPTPEHQRLLREAYLGRARQLREQGHARDAATVLQAALNVDGHNPAWLGQLAEELAALGEVRAALAALQRVPESPAAARVLARAADAALQQGEAGRKLLPQALHADFDRILQAWSQAEAGQDDAARATLQDIGLRSPFAEWKLFLRGLLAYYHRDDTRAVENWQRLDPDRLPARLAAPFRFAVDAPFRLAQQPAAQVALQKQYDQLQGHGLIQPLREIQVALAREGAMGRAFQMAANLLPALRAEAPALVPRLATCFYWAMITTGGPNDIPRYQRTFGTPPDDPHFHRLSALAYDRGHDLQEAHKFWQKYEQDVAASANVWPGDQATRVRALIWRHMGQNAASVPGEELMAQLPPFLRNHPARPKPLSPSAEKCFLRSLELAPDQLETHAALFEHYRKAGKEPKALQAGEELLRHFPGHVPTLEAMGELLAKKEKYAESLAMYQRALQAHPLDRRLRSRVGNAHLFKARAHAEEGDFAAARAEYQAARSYFEGDQSAVLCKWAACEFKAGDTARAEELVQQALAEGSTRLAVAHSMLIEVSRLRLGKALKDRFNREFNAALTEEPAAAAAVAVAETVAAHRQAGVSYHGQKTHDKKVLAYLDRAAGADFTEAQLKRLCVALLGAEAFKQMRKCCQLGQRKFPGNPHFPFLEAESYVAMGPARCPTWKALPLLDRAEKLAEAQPPDEEQKALLEAIRQRREMIGGAGLLGGRMLDVLEEMFGFDDLDEDEDDY
jgi:tetratricopeptide (TPR) repeat protein